MEGMVWGGGGWVGGGDNDVRYNYWTHCVRRWSSPFHHAFIVPLLTSHALHHSFPHIRMEGMVWGGVGGWVGGIMTFVTTTGHIVSVDDHHHFITHSSCHYSPLTHFIIRSRTYAWRVWYGGGGGWVGGGDNDVRYNYWTHCVRRWSSPFHHAFILPLLTSHALHHSFPHIRMEGMVWGGGWVGGWGG